MKKFANIPNLTERLKPEVRVSNVEIVLPLKLHGCGARVSWQAYFYNWFPYVTFLVSVLG